MAALRRALHTHFWGGGVRQAKSNQQMQFPCATAIGDEDDIMWKVMETAQKTVEPPLQFGSRLATGRQTNG